MPEFDEEEHQIPQHHTYMIRCAYVDYNREPADADRGSEFHWRCAALFTFNPYANAIERTRCAHHQAVVQQFPRETWTQGPHAVDRVTRALTMPDESLEKERDLTTAERQALEARRELLRQQAQEISRHQREARERTPGEDDA